APLRDNCLPTSRLARLAQQPQGGMGMTSRIIARRALLQGAGGLGLVGTLPNRAGAQGKEPLKLGITEPLTGSEAGYGADFVTVMRMAAKDVNDAGGINGHPLGLGGIDTQASPQLGINAANRLATIDKIPMFITAWSAVVKAQAPVANREKVLELSVGANAPDIAKLGDYVYTLFPLAEVDITALAQYTYEKLGKRRAAVAYINNETGIDAAKLYKATFESSGGQIVLFEAYDPKATEFSGMLLKMRAANPDMVHVHGLLVDTPLIIAQMRLLVPRVVHIAGYNRFSFTRASAVVNCQSALTCFLLRACSQAATSSVRVCLSGIRRSRH